MFAETSDDIWVAEKLIWGDEKGQLFG